jgi:hypothetical protein
MFAKVLPCIHPFEVFLFESAVKFNYESFTSRSTCCCKRCEDQE